MHAEKKERIDTDAALARLDEPLVWRPRHVNGGALRLLDPMSTVCCLANYSNDSNAPGNLSFPAAK
jgi:hypothetical protein